MLFSNFYFNNDNYYSDPIRRPMNTRASSRGESIRIDYESLLNIGVVIVFFLILFLSKYLKNNNN
jgi:hypothetical protein